MVCVWDLETGEKVIQVKLHCLHKYCSIWMSVNLAQYKFPNIKTASLFLSIFHNSICQKRIPRYIIQLSSGANFFHFYLKIQLDLNLPRNCKNLLHLRSRPALKKALIVRRGIVWIFFYNDGKFILDNWWRKPARCYTAF